MARAWIALAILLTAGSGRADTPKTGLRWRGSIAAAFGTTGGVGHREVTAPVFDLSASIKPSLRLGDFRFAVPLSLSHVERIDQPFDTTSGELGLIAGWRVSSWLRLGVDGGLGATGKFGWPDSFQPRSGELVSTDRFSHFDRSVGARAVVGVAKGHRLFARVEYLLEDGTNDPSFQPVLWPDHIAPSDHALASLDVGWRHRRKRLGIGVGLRLSERRDFFRFAQDAGTGQTHASPGGSPANPLRHLLGLAPSVDARFAISRRFRGKAAYTLEIVDDPFQGYRSSVSHRPEVAVEYRSRARVSVKAWVGVDLKRYGEDSYAVVGSHPPLDDGERRYDRRGRLGISGAAPLMKHVWLTAEARGLVRSTNFPDYQASVYPSNRKYDIDWDYEGWTVLLGLRVTK
ncbi:MAG: hypothetical protein HY791_11395 [Deltaproteobacteria bacterium]|nr:hypothetical protein [Deltaproteobacteria bacterium]